jgi:hypothetical protein
MNVDVTIGTADLQAALRNYVQDKFPDATIENVSVMSYNSLVFTIDCANADGILLVPERLGGLRHRVRDQ